jgi:hypothetical protein
MAKRTTKMEIINLRIEEINARRRQKHLLPVERCWTGAGHWLKEPITTLKSPEISGGYRSMGGIYVGDDKFLGFLEGLLYAMDNF